MAPMMASSRITDSTSKTTLYWPSSEVPSCLMDQDSDTASGGGPLGIPAPTMTAPTPMKKPSATTPAPTRRQTDSS